MYIPPIISILISVLFVWMTTSFVVMFCHEWLSSRLRWRAKMLETTIRNMLSDPALADQLYNHPLIRSLYSGVDGSSKPSYIPASQFAQALMDIVVGAASEASLIQHYLYKLRWELPRLDKNTRLEAQKRINILLVLTRRVLVSQLDENAQEAALDEIRAGLTTLGEDYPPLKATVESMMTTVAIQQNQIREGIKSATDTGVDGYPVAGNRYKEGLMALSITHPRLKQILGALLSELISAAVETESSQFRARQNIEDWFNNSMDRLSGWYRRRAQTLAYTLSILLAFLFNIDSLYLANILWQDAYTRDMVADTATVFMQKYPDGAPEMQLDEFLNGLGSEPWYNALPIGWIGFSDAAEGSIQGRCVAGSLGSAYHLRFLGQCYPLINLPGSNNLTGWVLKIFGLLITGIAAAQGAPFWFDILKKLINVRIAGANPIELKRAVG